MFACCLPEQAPLPLQPCTRPLTDPHSLTVARCAAAEGGSAEGQYEMGRMWFRGRVGGLPRDYEEASKYWRLAAAQA